MKKLLLLVFSILVVGSILLNGKVVTVCDKCTKEMGSVSVSSKYMEQGRTQTNEVFGYELCDTCYAEAKVLIDNWMKK